MANTEYAKGFRNGVIQGMERSTQIIAQQLCFDTISLSKCEHQGCYQLQEVIRMIVKEKVDARAS